MHRYSATFLLMLVGVRTLQAHPGHGISTDSYSAWHYLSEPEHITVGAVLALVGLVVTRLVPIWKRRTRLRRAGAPSER